MNTYLSIHGVEKVEIGKKETEETADGHSYQMQRITIKSGFEEHEITLFFEDEK